VIHCLIVLVGFDLDGQSGLLVYRRRTKQTTSLSELPPRHLNLGEATEMAATNENRPLKDFIAPKAIGI
jgi:hypothetical protein